MAILVMCPNPACGELLEVAQRSSQEVLCPVCGSVVRQAQPSGPARPLPPKPDAAAPGPASTPAQAPPAAPVKAVTPVPTPPAPAGQTQPGEEEIIFDIKEEPPPASVRAASFNPLPIETPEPPPKPPLRQPGRNLPRTAPPQPAEPAPQASPAPPPGTAAAAGSDFEGEMVLLPTEKIVSGDLPLRLPRQLDESSGSLSELADKAERIEAARASRVVELIGVEDAKQTVASLPHSGKIMLVSLAGLAGGLLTGLGMSGWDSLLAAYAGAGAGYAAGFVLSFVVVLAVERHPSLARLRPLAVEGLQAASYAWRKVALALRPARLLISLGLLFLCSNYLLGRYPLPQRLQPYILPSQWVGGVILAWLAVSFWLDFFVTAVKAALMEEPFEELAPPVLSLRALVRVPRDLAALAFYALPVLTLPLLPLLPLRLAGVRVAGSASPFHLPGTLLIARRRSGDFAILWLLLLLYGSAMAAVISVGVMLCHWLGPLLEMFLSAASRELILAALDLAVAATAGSFFCLAGARCVGIFGRCCAGQE